MSLLSKGRSQNGRLLKNPENKKKKRNEDNHEETFMKHEDNTNNLILDSGASRQMNPFEYEFDEIKPLKEAIEISIVDGKKLKAKREGNVTLKLKNRKVIKVENVYQTWITS